MVWLVALLVHMFGRMIGSVIVLPHRCVGLMRLCYCAGSRQPESRVPAWQTVGERGQDMFRLEGGCDLDRVDFRIWR